MDTEPEIEPIAADQSIENVIDFIDTLRRIVARLYEEGYAIKDGELLRLERRPELPVEVIIEW